jgi:hypothetical protein
VSNSAQSKTSVSESLSAFLERLHEKSSTAVKTKKIDIFFIVFLLNFSFFNGKNNNYIKWFLFFLSLKMLILW